MKVAILNLAVAASLAAAQPHHHGHHLHHRRNSPVEKRDVETTYVAATVTQYMLGNEEVTAEEAQAGLDKGLYVVVGETTPTVTTPTAAAATTTSSKEAAVFVQQITTSSSTSSSSSSSTTEAAAVTVQEAAIATTSSAAVVATSAASSSSSSSSSSGATGIDADFPDGELSCDTFPSEYGAIALDYLGTGGFSGIQYTPSWSFSGLVSYIETAVGLPSGETGFYSYACPDGYVKSQWPADSQGSTGQSVGGLLCKNGKLHLTRSDVSSKLCEEGVGGVKIVNKMSKGTSVCRTDYPGTENMVIPVDVVSGYNGELANINQDSYYQWEGQKTTLQYYVNKKGVSAQDGCTWTCAFDPEGCGNWAPAIIGTGIDNGINYLALFQNKESLLDYNVDITVNGENKCSYTANTAMEGCTVGVPEGETAIITFSE
ncbi:beta-glucosidase-domain-containing protein [Xylariaceae sp. FL0804]|nr:beta-glucosidase-domain-containing protein [Xylariaceae sp. FL0804]